MFFIHMSIRDAVVSYVNKVIKFRLFRALLNFISEVNGRFLFLKKDIIRNCIVKDMHSLL